MKASAAALASAALLGAATLIAAGPGLAESLSGKVEVMGIVAIDPSIPKTATITATVDVELDAAGGFRRVSGAANLVPSAGKASYDLVLPYAWTVSNPSAMLVALTVTANTAMQPYASITVTIAVPANGGITIVDIPASI